jgi:N-methyl-L-proline demethylase
LEIVTPERTLGIDVGGMNMVPYARVFNEKDTRISLNQRLISVRRRVDGRLEAEIGSDHSSRRVVRTVDCVVVDHGAAVNASVYENLRDRSSNRGAVNYSDLLAGRA